MKRNLCQIFAGEEACSFGRGLFLVYFVFFAALAYWQGVQGDQVRFDSNAIYAAFNGFVAAKLHSRVKRLHRQRGLD